MKNKIQVAALSLATLLALSGCASGGYNFAPPMMNSSQEQFEQQDLMFSVMMIPHHQQAIDLSELAISKSDSEQIRVLSEQIIAGQGPEIILMQRWLDESNEFDGMSNMMQSEALNQNGSMRSGMNGMGGMASEADIELLATLSSPNFDALFLDLMIEHHLGAIDMVQMIENSNNPEVQNLAGEIIRVQTEEINLMQQIQQELS